MKRTFALVILVALLVTAIVPVVHAGHSVMGVFVVRPKVYLNSKKGSGHIRYLPFGTHVEILEYEYDYCRVRVLDDESEEENKDEIGYIYTGYLDYVIEKVWLMNDDGSGGVALSILPNMNPGEFGYAAGGRRINEAAFVLFEQGDYQFVVTQEGYSGYIYKYDRNVISDDEYWWRHEQEMTEEKEHTPVGGG